jgi:hypothetical protein
LIKDKKQTELATVPPTDGGTIAASHLEIFGPPPLLVGESQEVYDTLLARVTGTVNPKDVIEEIWVHDRRSGLGDSASAAIKGRSTVVIGRTRTA